MRDAKENQLNSPCVPALCICNPKFIPESELNRPELVEFAIVYAQPFLEGFEDKRLLAE